MKETIQIIAAVLAIPALIIKDNSFIEVVDFQAKACVKTKAWHTFQYKYDCVSLEGLK